LDILHILYEGFSGSMSTMLKVAVIVIPLMVFLQFIQELKILDRCSFLFTPFSRILGISKPASLSLLAGLFFGIAYGSGVIIQTAREGLLTKRDRYLVIIFLAVCHSIFEDNILFVAIGADPYILFFGRLALAILITFIVSRFWKEEGVIAEPDDTVVFLNHDHRTTRGDF